MEKQIKHVKVLKPVPQYTYSSHLPTARMLAIGAAYNGNQRGSLELHYLYYYWNNPEYDKCKS